MTDTHQPSRPGRPQPDWNLTVLAHPVVLDVPDVPNVADPTIPTPAHTGTGAELDGGHLPDPLAAAAVAALVATRDRSPDAHLRIGDLGRAGVVALRTSAGALVVQETLLGWVLVKSWGDPDPHDLAAAAHLRAWRLAAERRDWPSNSDPASDIDPDLEPHAGLGPTDEAEADLRDLFRSLDLGVGRTGWAPAEPGAADTEPAPGADTGTGTWQPDWSWPDEARGSGPWPGDDPSGAQERDPDPDEGWA